MSIITATGPSIITQPSGRVIYTGDPGTTWVNDTNRVQYQFICSFVNSCGICIQYSMQIGAPWPIPLHFSCRCQQRAIRVGAAAPNPFADFRQIIDDLPPDQRGKVVGVSNLKLLDAGVVKWSDVVTGSRIRDLREVVDRHSLSVKTLVGAGLKPSIAEQAYSAVHTTEHEHAARQRRELMAKLIGAGVHSDKLISALSKGLASRVSIAAGPGSLLKSGEQLGPAWAGGRLLPTAGDDLARALLGMKLVGGKIVAPKLKLPAVPKTAETAVPRPFEPPVEVSPAVPTYGPGEDIEYPE